jgi:uncharacterized protein (TIGR00297 family)
MGVGGLAFAAPLVAFFATSSAWSAWRRRRKATPVGETTGRTAAQVIANGLVAGGLVGAAALTPAAASPSTRDWYLLYLCAVAATNADTWATEVGSAATRSSRLITTWRQVPAGTSGGISLAGSAAALAGAVCVVAVAWLAWPSASETMLWRIDLAEALAVVWSGWMASLVDSLLGATLEGHYRCARCGDITETGLHCHVRGSRVRGLGLVGNGSVNFTASLVSVAIGWFLLRVFAWPT